MNALTPIPISALSDFKVGHSTIADGASGCTVVVAPAGATGGVDVRGGAPASRETDLLKPVNTVDAVHAVCLSGGSAYGLEAASGVMRALESRGIGLNVGVGLVPIVCSSCIFDLAYGDPSVRPGIDNGIEAVTDALDSGEHAELQGNVGAGTGATVGKLAGMERSMKGGLGAQAFQMGELKVAAISAVNACGNVYDPASGSFIAGMRTSADGTEVADMEDAMLAMAANVQMPLDRTNTTISCIFTNATLTKAQCTKVAQMAADAYAHTIRPTHTSNDGDTIYVLASGSLKAELPIDLVGLAATKTLEAAIVEGTKAAQA